MMVNSCLCLVQVLPVITIGEGLREGGAIRHFPAERGPFCGQRRLHKGRHKATQKLSDAQPLIPVAWGGDMTAHDKLDLQV